MKFAPALIRATVFVVISAVCAVMMSAQLRGGQPSGRPYAALFTDSSNLKEGSDVRAAGVIVGRVESVEVQPDNLIKVGFEVRTEVPMTASTRAMIRYKNLTGDRYLELAPGAGASTALPVGGVIPASRTTPALDLDTLYNGFAPLFEGLQPAQINQLTGSIVQVLQGQAGSVGALLTQIGSLTSTLADKDVVIGRLIENLNGVLATLDAHSGALDELVVQLTDLVSGLEKDRDRIGRSLAGINGLAGSAADLLRDARPDLAGTVHQVDRLATVVNADSERIDDRLRNYPGYYPLLARVGSYSSAFQFYICGLQLWLQDGDGPATRTPVIMSGEQRCRF